MLKMSQSLLKWCKCCRAFENVANVVEPFKMVQMLQSFKMLQSFSNFEFLNVSYTEIPQNSERCTSQINSRIF